MPTIQEIAAQVRNGNLDLGYKHYALGLMHGIVQAQYSGYKKIIAIEFGVGTGIGLLSLIKAAEYFRNSGIDIEVYGFDTGTGLPTPTGDYRDHPEIWTAGQIAMPGSIENFKKNLPPWAHFIQGNVSETIDTFVEEFEKNDSVVGFVSMDLDYYSSTKDALKIFEMTPTKYVPAVPIYFDDMNWLITYSQWAGVGLAIKEFNEEHELRKLESKEIYFQIENFYVCHVFDNPIRTGAQSPVTQFEIFAKPTGMVHPIGGVMI